MKFETKVVLVNKWDEVVCELVEDGYFYKFPMDFVRNPLLDVGDEYKVREIEVEVE